jgi:hypothetical protein
MGKAERKGYTYWELALKAGAVGTEITYTDDPVVRDHAIGKTREQMGACYPMDMAVAYSLACVGPAGSLTINDLVNEYTRKATLMMTGKVGYGKCSNPTIESCGHDMVNTWIHTMPEVECYEDESTRVKFLYFASTTPDDNDLHTFRSDEQYTCPYEIIFGVDEDGNPHEEMSAFRKHYEEKYDCKVWKKSSESPARVNITHTIGTCLWEDDDEKTCFHHDESTIEDWFLIKDGPDKFLTIWRSGKNSGTHSGWNRDQISNSLGWGFGTKIHRDRLVLFSTVARNLSHQIDEKEVIKQVRKSLARMIKWTGGRSLVEIIHDETAPLTKYGKYKRTIRTRYKWSDWSWVADLDSFIQDTRSKGRKVGDRVCSKCYSEGVTDAYGNHTCHIDCNEGWLYDKYESKESYGHEIAKFRWIPIMGNDKYPVGHAKEGKRIPRPHLFGYSSWPEMSILFDAPEKADAASAMLVRASQQLGATVVNSEYDAQQQGRVQPTSEDLKEIGLSVTRIGPSDRVWVTLTPDIEPETTMTAKQMFMKLMRGSPSDWDDAKKLFESCLHTHNERYSGSVPYSRRGDMESRFRVKVVGDRHSDSVYVDRPSVVEQEVEELAAEELV